MIPYNICENKWVSYTKNIVKKHYMEYEPLYVVLFISMSIFLVVFALATMVSSFI